MSSDDWNSVTRIGKSHGEGGQMRETTIRGQGALNAALRSGGVVNTERKQVVSAAFSKIGGKSAPNDSLFRLTNHNVNAIK
jgi:hypothetical protein